ncbi:hypothetical protein HOLleu_05586 [Holothuria leucospilota]|uniref:Uncharacterized protein n=1 Tax=Holothuria leucospilota TaxID=206669 RepID=A0A9Q1HEM8_HOLLE|nr:hypothetical protein HOLleu_05586 [Holothuria leucospilota]
MLVLGGLRARSVWVVWLFPKHRFGFQVALVQCFIGLSSPVCFHPDDWVVRTSKTRSMPNFYCVGMLPNGEYAYMATCAGPRFVMNTSLRGVRN